MEIISDLSCKEHWFWFVPVCQFLYCLTRTSVFTFLQQKEVLCLWLRKEKVILLAMPQTNGCPEIDVSL